MNRFRGGTAGLSGMRIMLKSISKAGLLVAIGVGTVFANPVGDASGIEQKFVPAGITQKIGGYRPIRAEMSEEAKGVSKSPEGLEAPKFGQIELDGKSWAFILDERSEGDAKLYVDTNSDGDLTNDPETEWVSRKQGEMTMYSGKAKVQLGPDQIGEIGLYRFDPNDPARAALKNTLMFFVDFGSEFQLKLDDKEFSTFVAGPLSEKASLPMDRNGDGRVSRNYETVQIGTPFNFTGKTYVLDAVDGKLSLKQSDTDLPMLPMPPDLRLGKKALEFTATTMDGKELTFPSDYKGKIVMLDFWATWCGPCIAEIPNMKTAYEAHHENGFEILGVSFDQANMEEKVKTFLDERELTWPQIYEGKFWETSLGKMHDVSGIPFVLLVDGDTGEILGTSRELRGEKLSDFIGEQLGKKKGSN
jgi:thiol-disulfide isomerase/thioredoxin